MLRTPSAFSVVNFHRVVAVSCLVYPCVYGNILYFKMVARYSKLANRMFNCRDAHPQSSLLI